MGRLIEVRRAVSDDEIAMFLETGPKIFPGTPTLEGFSTQGANLGRSIAAWAALKRSQIEAARARGYPRLLTESQHENEPMRRLNEKLGFRPEPSMSTVVLRGPLAGD